MSITLEFYGIAAYKLILDDGKTILIDPFLNENPVSPVKAENLQNVDLILATHLAQDHLGDTPAIAKKFRCPVVCGAEVGFYLTKCGVSKGLLRTGPGHGQGNPLGVRVRSVPSMHASARVSPDGTWVSGMAMGFIVYASDTCRIYHSGDSAIYSDLSLIGKLYKPTVGIFCACEIEQEYLLSMGLKDHYGNEMSGEEGGMAAELLGVRYALCCHYLNPEGRKDVSKFKDYLAQNQGIEAVILKPGESFVVPEEGGKAG